jgi:hypothetical protein
MNALTPRTPWRADAEAEPTDARAVVGETAAADLGRVAEDLFAQLQARLQAWDEAVGGRERRGASKLVATLALALEVRRLTRRPRAIAVAARIVGVAQGASAAVQKKFASEARALIAHAAQDVAPAMFAGASDGELLEQLDNLFAPVSIRKALLERADQLAGARGGRPARTPGDVSAELRRLIELANAGDPAAHAELIAVSRQIQLWALGVLERSQGGAKA